MEGEKDYNILKSYVLHEIGHMVHRDIDVSRPSGACEARAHSWAIAFAIRKLMNEDIAGILIDLAKTWMDLPKTKNNKIYIRASKILQKGWNT